MLLVILPDSFSPHSKPWCYASKLPHCLWELCSEHCGNDFPLIVRELILKCNLYLSSKSTWITNVMEIYLTSILSTMSKHLKWLDKDLTKFGGKSGHGFTSLIQSCILNWFIFKSENFISDYFSSLTISTITVLSHISRVQLFGTQWTVACQAPLSTGLSRQEHWSELPCSSPADQDLPDPANQHLLRLLHWQAGSLQPALPGKQPTTTFKVLFSHKLPFLMHKNIF